MKIIAHRALLDGKNDAIENHPDQHQQCWAEGFHTEADLWVVNGKCFLGHDKPQHEVPEWWLEQKWTMWIHCKNFDALTLCESNRAIARYFWHQNDDYTLTNQQFVWTYPKAGLSLGKLSIPVILNPWEMTDPDHYLFPIEEVRKCYAVCTDYPAEFERLLS